MREMAEQHNRSRLFPDNIFSYGDIWQEMAEINVIEIMIKHVAEYCVRIHCYLLYCCVFAQPSFATCKMNTSALVHLQRMQCSLLGKPFNNVRDDGSVSARFLAHKEDVTCRNKR